MKRLKVDKVKRGRIILSALLTAVIALLSLGFGAYFGYVTLNVNYITLGTMTPAIGGLLVIAGFFIFFGCLGGVIAVKEIFISSRNEEKFSAYKGSLISAMAFYIVIALISIVGIIFALMSYIPSSFTWTIFALAILTLLLCGGAFYCVLKEMKEHKKKTKNKNKKQQSQYSSSVDNGIANMNLPASEIHKLKSTSYWPEGTSQRQAEPITNFEQADYRSGDRFREDTVNPQSRVQEQNFQESQWHLGRQTDEQYVFQQPFYRNQTAQQTFMRNYQTDQNRVEKIEKIAKELDFATLAEKLMQLEELRKAGLINDQEYQELKRKCIV